MQNIIKKPAKYFIYKKATKLGFLKLQVERTGDITSTVQRDRICNVETSQLVNKREHYDVDRSHFGIKSSQNNNKQL